MDRLDEFLALLEGVAPKGDGWEAKCPAHNDVVASLSVKRGDDGRVLCHCHAGCDKTSICHAIGKSTAWLFPDHGLPENQQGRKVTSGRPKGQLSGSFDYFDQFGALVYQAVRYDDFTDGRQTKTFTQRRPNGQGGWIYNMSGVDKVPYRLPELIKSHKSEPVYIVEGERKADKLASWGFIATCNVGGASRPRDHKWLKSYNQYFSGRDVVLLADNDDPGKTHIANVADNLKGIANSIVAVELPGLPPKGDILDWEAAGGTAAELKRLTALAVIAPTPIEAPKHVVKDKSEFYAVLDRLKLHVTKEDESGRVKVYSEDTRKDFTIKDVSKLPYAHLMQACGPGVLAVVYSGNDSTPPDMVRLADVKQAIALAASDKRDMDELGSGVWEGRSDGVTRDSIVLVGAGEAAIMNGSGTIDRLTRPQFGAHVLSLGSSDQWFDFDELGDRIKNYTPAWAEATVNELTTIFDGWWFGDVRQPIMPAVLSGLVLATWLQSLWRWRPQVFVLGKSNSGKSTLFEFLAGGQHTLGIFGHLVISSGDATAAGIAQTVRNSSKAIILDEMENSKKRSGVFELLRNAGRGQVRVRGTTHQNAASSGIQHIVWAAATESGLKKEVDRNRFIIANLLMPPPEKMGMLRLPPEDVTVDLGQRLLAVAVKTAFRAVELSQVLKDNRPPGYHYRVCESYSVPAAAYAAAMGMDEGQAINLLEEFLGTTDPTEIEGDELRMLTAILQHIIPVKGGERYSVAQALYTARHGFSSSLEAEHALDAHGVHLIRRDKHPKEGWTGDGELCVFLNPSAVEKNIMKHDMEFNGMNCKEILMRLPGAMDCRRRIDGSRPHGVLLPYALIERDELPHVEPFSLDGLLDH